MECSNCVSCEKCYSQQGGGTGNEFVFYVFLGAGCNLRCSYCYASNKTDPMSYETMVKTADYLVHKQPNKKFNIHFFGGEPTFYWENMEKFISLIRSMKPASMEINFSMTTNGTMLNNQRLEFMRDNFRSGNPFLLSLDGRKETHNKHRKMANGKDSYDLIPVKDILTMFPNTEVRPTIKADTVEDWFEDYRYLRNLGFKSIAIEPDYEDDWTVESLYNYENTLDSLGEYWLVAQRVNKPIQMKWIDTVIGGLKSGMIPKGKMCGVGANCQAIDYLGNIYACQRYASYNDPSLAIGTIETGVDEFILLQTQNLLRQNVVGNSAEGFICSTCPAVFYCNKGCNAAGFKVYGRRDIAPVNYCRLQKIEVEVAINVLSKTGLLRFFTPATGGVTKSCGKSPVGEIS